MKKYGFFRNLFADNIGATAIEYGPISALIAVSILTAVQSLGTSVKNTFGTVAEKMQ